MGVQGPNASTDIYDASVERETERREGVVFVLGKLQSRKFQVGFFFLNVIFFAFSILSQL